MSKFVRVVLAFAPILVACGDGGSETSTASVTGDAGDSGAVAIEDAGAAPAAPVDHAPVAVDDALTATAETATPIPVGTLLSNDTDADGDTLTVTSVTATTDTHGTVSLDAGSAVFSPDNGYRGKASFLYTVADPAGATAQATVRVCVGGVCTDPTAVNDVYADTTAVDRQDKYDLTTDAVPTTAYDALAVTTNDQIVVSSSIGIITPPAHGKALVDGNVVRYIPDKAYCNDDGTSYDTLVYALAPGGSQARVDIKVRCVTCTHDPASAGCPCEGLTRAVSNGIPSNAVKNACVATCTGGCADEGPCVFGCEIGGINNADTCASSCSGLGATCADPCNATVACISSASIKCCAGTNDTFPGCPL